MKRILSFVMVCVSVLCLASCSWNLDDPALQTTELISGVDFLNQLEQGKNVVFEPSSYFMKHAKLSIGNGVFHCQTTNASHLLYNPITDQAHYMCFDPSCTHKRTECLAKRLMSTHYFTYYEGDLYCVYYDGSQDQASKSGIAKISPDGSSMKLLYKMDPNLVRGIKAGNGFVYVSKDDGLYRYEIATGESKVFTGSESILNGFVITDRGLLTHTSKDRYVTLCDYDLGNRKPLFKNSLFVYAGDKVYYAYVVYEEDGKTRKHAEFYEYDLDTDENRYITTQVDYADVLCYYDGYLYYASRMAKGVVTLQYSDKIYKMDVNTGLAEEVYNSNTAYIKQLYCIDGMFYACVQGLGYKDTFGKMVDKNHDGMFEFEPFVWDTTGILS